MGVQVPGLGQTLRASLGRCLSLVTMSCLGKHISFTLMRTKDPLSLRCAIAPNSASAGQ